VWGTVTGGQVTWYGANGTVRPIDWVSVVQSMTDEQVFLLLKTITTTLAPTVTTSGGTGSF